MGNEESNRYWEAELPPNYNRVPIENFIRAKYEEKRWVAKIGIPSSPSRVQEEKQSFQRQSPSERTGRTVSSENPSNVKKRFQAQATKTGIPATRISLPTPPKGPEPVMQKAEPAVPSPEAKKAADEAVSSPKVNIATDLFDMISMDGGPTENGSEATSTDDNLWVGFQSTGEASSKGKASPSKPVENDTKHTEGVDLFKDSSPISQPNVSENPQKDVRNAEVSTTGTTNGIEDLFKESSPISQPSASERPQKDVKNDIMSLFEKGDTVSQYSNHQQQRAMLAQQQYLLMAAAAKSGGLPEFAGNSQQPNAGYQMMTPACGRNELEKYQQQQLAMLAQQQSLLMAAAAKSGCLPEFAGNKQQPTNPASQNQVNVGNQSPGTMMADLGRNELQKYLQQMGNIEAAKLVGSSGQVPTSSTYAMTTGVPSSPGLIGKNASLNNTGSPGSSASSSQSAKDDDFSSLTKGMFTKR